MPYGEQETYRLQDFVARTYPQDQLQFTLRPTVVTPAAYCYQPSNLPSDVPRINAPTTQSVFPAGTGVRFQVQAPTDMVSRRSLRGPCRTRQIGHTNRMPPTYSRNVPCGSDGVSPAIPAMPSSVAIPLDPTPSNVQSGFVSHLHKHFLGPPHHSSLAGAATRHL